MVMNDKKYSRQMRIIKQVLREQEEQETRRKGEDGKGSNLSLEAS
jgi:hypothetical protein